MGVLRELARGTELPRGAFSSLSINMFLERTFVGTVQAPITEEVVFRSCVIAIYGLAGASKKVIIFGSPLIFGLGASIYPSIFPTVADPGPSTHPPCLGNIQRSRPKHRSAQGRRDILPYVQSPSSTISSHQIAYSVPIHIHNPLRLPLFLPPPPHRHRPRPPLRTCILQLHGFPGVVVSFGEFPG